MEALVIPFLLVFGILFHFWREVFRAANSSHTPNLSKKASISIAKDHSLKPAHLGNENSVTRHSHDENVRMEAARKEEYWRQQERYIEDRNKEYEHKENAKREEYLLQQAKHLKAREDELRAKELRIGEAQRLLDAKEHDIKSQLETEAVKKSEYEYYREKYEQMAYTQKVLNRKDECLNPETIAESKNVNAANKIPSFNTGISELDGPGMYQRLTACGPQGQVCYLLYSKEHNAYKVGHCPHDYLGQRIKQISQSVPDVVLYGSAVFTTRQNAFDAEQKVLAENRNFKYSGIRGDHAGSTEWIRRKPSGRRPSFLSPKAVEANYQRQLDAPLQPIEVPDLYTVYLVYSKDKNAYKAKWCKSENLSKKLSNLRSESSDIEMLSRFKVEEHHKAREIAKKFNEEAGSFLTVGRRDEVEWVENPTYLKYFKSWDKYGSKIQ